MSYRAIHLGPLRFLEVGKIYEVNWLNERKTLFDISEVSHLQGTPRLLDLEDFLLFSEPELPAAK